MSNSFLERTGEEYLRQVGYTERSRPQDPPPQDRPEKRRMPPPARANKICVDEYDPRWPP